jgi:uncharacterized protein (DUF736 family)
MADFEQRELSGVLFKNAKKTTDKHPDYTGNCLILGEKMSISAWIKISSNGNKFMSLAFSEPYESKPAATKQAARESMDDLSDDVPF